MRIYRNRDRPLTEVRFAAVAVAEVGPGQRHIGILHRDADSLEVRLVHLAWHRSLKESKPSDAYLWVDPPIPERRARHLAAMCRLVLRANPNGIPYAFSAPNDCIDAETGRYLLGPTRFGLTCASFVLAVFEVVGLRLASYDSWPSSRGGDEEWQRSVLEQLRKSGAELSHLEHVKIEIGASRYRPEEVAGCAAAARLPCLFEVASDLASVVMELLESHATPLRGT